MTVEPGKGGQKLITPTLNKINELFNILKETGSDVLIEADGGVNLENINLVKTAGAEIIVSGTGIIGSENYKETIDKMKEE
jgi:ribulose-phosphate 3-epimerase